MMECPHCTQDEMYRVHRTAPERLLYAQSFECRSCGHRWRVKRPTLEYIAARLRRRRVPVGRDSKES
jgi:transposase-like protein